MLFLFHSQQISVKLLIFICSIVILFTSGCEPDYEDLITSPSVLPVTVLVVLNPAADSQYVILTTGNPPWDEAEKVMERESRLFAQATINLTVNGRQLSFCHQYQFPGPSGVVPVFNRVSTDPVFPGEDCFLEVEIPYKEKITAATKVPGDFQLLLPQPGDSLRLQESIPVKWTASADAAGYRVSLFILTEIKRRSYPDTTKKFRSTWFSAGEQYLPADASRQIDFQHDFDYYFTSPPDTSYIRYRRAVLHVEALDPAAWTAHELNTLKQAPNSGYRLEVVDFSNIKNGHGLMIATITKSAELLFQKVRYDE